MRKSFFKTIALFISVSFVLLFSFSRLTYADIVTVASGTCGPNLEWSLDNMGTLTISGEGDMTDWSKQSALPWKDYVNNIRSIDFSGNVTSIGDYAFYGCSSLRFFDIPEGVVSIGDYAFYECSCSGFNGKFPEGLTYIGNSAFYGCGGLASITIPSGITSINDNAFSYCRELASVSLPNGLTEIGRATFIDCEELTSINIPNTVNYIGDYAFDYCKKLTSITIPNGVTAIGETTFYCCESLTSVSIPESVKTIGNMAFYHCPKLVNVNIPDGVISIGDNAFDSCSSITSLDIPNSVKTIGDGAFSGCSFSSITIPSGIKKIGDRTFWGCRYLTDITIPNSVTTIGERTFAGCVGLTSITIPNTVTSIGDYAFQSSGLTSFTLSNGSTTIGKGAFKDCLSLASITIPNGVKTIASETFSGCTAITSIILPNSVTTIGTYAFQGSSLTSIELSNKLTKIEFGAFQNCNSLKTITIPDSITSIGQLAFSNCTGIETVQISGNSASLGASCFADCTGLTSVVITSGVKSIGQGTFKGCTGLVSITLPKGLSSIDKNAFQSCSKLSAIVIPESVSSIGTDAFLSCKNLKSVVINKDIYSRDAFPSLSSSIFHYYYAVSYTNDGNGSVSGNARTYGTDLLDLTITPKSNCRFDTLTWSDDQKTVVLTPDSNGKYVMPDSEGNVVIKALFKVAHSISIDKLENGTATVSKELAFENEKITISYEANACYELDSITVNGITLNGTEFTMPDESAKIVVLFKAIPHNLTKVASKQATCTEDGHEAYYECSVCHKLFSDAEGENEISKPVIPKLNHLWDDGEVTKEPTCEETGTKILHCTREGCSETKTESIVALGHKIKAVSAKEPTKTEPGNTAYYECERCHKLFKDENGIQEISLADTVIPAMGHDLTAVKAKAATCTEPGNTAYYICKDDDCKCGKAYSDPYGQHEINIEDTVKPALGHNPEEVAGKDPTCTEDGYEKYYKCSRCHKLFSDAEGKNEIEKPVAISKLGHDMNHVEAKKPTHDDDGHREYYHCDRCGKNFADSEGSNPLADAELVVPRIGAAVLGEEITEGDFIYKVSNPRTDGTGTVTIIGVANKTSAVVIPATVELKLDTYKVNRIGAKAFYGNKTITSLSIGSNVVVIDSYAFYGCSNLVKVSGGKVLKTIGSKAFAYCSKLKSFSISSSVLNKIGSYAFQKDKKLKTVYIKYTTKLTKKGVKKSLKGSKVKTVKVKKSKVKKYKKYFTKKNAGRKVKVKK